MAMAEEILFRVVWDAACADVTGLIASLDKMIETHGGNRMTASASLARALDENSPGQCWLASRLAVALFMMNDATGPIADKLAQDVMAELKKLL
jgi:hypothetical protein